jgi:hypothetical protein
MCRLKIPDQGIFQLFFGAKNKWPHKLAEYRKRPNKNGREGGGNLTPSRNKANMPEKIAHRHNLFKNWIKP